MINERQCRLCKYLIVKNKFFGGKKFTCSIHNREVAALDMCSQFVRDGNKVLQCAGFRPHEFGSSDGCDTCTHRDSTYGKSGTIYSCKKNNVQFWPGFSPMEHICNNFEDGGIDTLVDYMADLLVEQDRFKKGGK